MRIKLVIGILVISLIIISTTFIMGNKTGVTGKTIIKQNLEINKSVPEENIKETQNNFNEMLNAVKQDIMKIELNKHNKLEDCWVVYKSRVYDITSWLPKHPGTAQVILPNCGTAEEFEKAFTQKHGTTKASLLMRVGVFIGDFEDKGVLQ